MFSNSPPIIEIYNTGHALQNKTYLIGQYTRADWQCFAKSQQNIGRNTGGHNWPKTFLGGVYRYSINASTAMNYIFTELYTISKFYVKLYLLSYCVFHFSWRRVYVYIYVYMCVCVYIYVYVYIYICLRMHVTMYTWLYVCLLCVLILCMLILWCFFYLWLLGQRWPNKKVQTNITSIFWYVNLFIFYKAI